MYQLHTTVPFMDEYVLQQVNIDNSRMSGLKPMHLITPETLQLSGKWIKMPYTKL